MKNDRLSRNKSLKIPKIIKNETGPANTLDDLFSVKQGSAMGFNVKFNKDKEFKKAEILDEELNMVSKISEESSDLVVITRAKKLGAYILAISMKTPQRFRMTYVARMQNLCLDAISNMFFANAIHADCPANKNQRERYQTDSIIKLKMLGYIALLSENAGCILLRQYKQISLQLENVISMTSAWRKSDNEKWLDKQKDLG
jgi:hypothetical protein